MASEGRFAVNFGKVLSLIKNSSDFFFVLEDNESVFNMFKIHARFGYCRKYFFFHDIQHKRKANVMQCTPSAIRLT